MKSRPTHNPQNPFKSCIEPSPGTPPGTGKPQPDSPPESAPFELRRPLSLPASFRFRQNETLPASGGLLDRPAWPHSKQSSELQSAQVVPSSGRRRDDERPLRPCVGGNSPPLVFDPTDQRRLFCGIYILEQTRNCLNSPLSAISPVLAFTEAAAAVLFCGEELILVTSDANHRRDETSVRRRRRCSACHPQHTGPRFHG